MRAVGRSGGLAVAVVVLTACPPVRLTAQTDPRLAAALQLAQGGRQDSARAMVARLLVSLPPTDSVYPQALYTAGILAADPPTVERDLQRVVVEYGMSSWADDALLRLTQFYFAQGDPAATVQAAERLRRDYPGSPLIARADFPAARAYFDLKDEAHGCALIREAMADTSADVELKNQLGFYSARCPVTPPPGAPPAAAPPDTSKPAPAAPPPGFAIQVLAVKSATQVDQTLTRLKVMGYDARVDRDSTGFFKVRVGHYATRADADKALRQLRLRLGGSPFIVEEP